jgi:putative ABC transport system permease protein
MVDLATKILLHDRTRFAITVAGVAFAVALVFVQVGLFEGLLSSATVTIEREDAGPRRAADLWVTARNTPNVDFSNTFPETYVQRVRSVPGVERADNLIVWFATVALPSGARETAVVYAMEHFDRWNLPWRVVEGDPEDLRRGKFVMLDESARKRFGAFAVGDFREFQGQRLKIIGRTREAKSFTTTPIAFTSYRLAQALNPQELQQRTTYILVKLKPGTDVEAARRAIAARLPFNDVHTQATWARLSRGYWTESTGLGLNMYTTVFLGCLVGVVVVAQTLYTATMDHLKEFATVKAIGGTNGEIYRILAKQAVIAAVVGYALGTGLAFALKPVMAGLDLNLLIGPGLLLAVLIGTVVLCVGASALSFRQVAGLDPALVFRG